MKIYKSQEAVEKDIKNGVLEIKEYIKETIKIGEHTYNKEEVEKALKDLKIN